MVVGSSLLVLNIFIKYFALRFTKRFLPVHFLILIILRNCFNVNNYLDC